jgi:hypothetical protein
MGNAGICGILLCFITAMAMPGRADETVWLEALDLGRVAQGWGTLQRNASVQGNPLTIDGQRFEHGLGTHAKSRIIIDLDGMCTRFGAFVGVDDEVDRYPEASVEFVVVGDRKVLWQSGVLKAASPAVQVDVDVSGVRTLELIVTDAGDGNYADHADWADAKLVATTWPVAADHVYLSDPRLEPVVVRPQWRAIAFDWELNDAPLRIADQEYARGLAGRAGSDVIITSLGGRFSRFESWIGLDGRQGSARFRVLVDGAPAYESGVVLAGSAPEFVTVPIPGARELRLVVDPVSAVEVGDACWGDALLRIDADKQRLSALPAKYTVRSDRLSVELSEQGEVVGIIPADGHRRDVGARTHLAGCHILDGTKAKMLRNGGVEFRKRLVDEISRQECDLVERFTPTKTSVRWEIEIDGRGGPWSTAIETELAWADVAGAKFWTAWGDSDPGRSSGWSDPLVPMPFGNRRYWYGAAAYRDSDPTVGYSPWRYDIVSLPIATIIENGSDLGFSVVLSPEDVLMDMQLTTDERGQSHREGKAGSVRYGSRNPRGRLALRARLAGRSLSQVLQPAQSRCG